MGIIDLNLNSKCTNVVVCQVPKSPMYETQEKNLKNYNRKPQRNIHTAKKTLQRNKLRKICMKYQTNM